GVFRRCGITFNSQERPKPVSFYSFRGSLSNELCLERHVAALLFATARDHRSQLQPLPASGAKGFKRAVLRRLVSGEGGEFHLARDQIRCFKFSLCTEALWTAFT